MKNLKAVGLLLSAVVVFGIATPGTLAVGSDADDSDTKFSVEEMTEEPVYEQTIPVESNIPTESTAPTDNSKPSEDENHEEKTEEKQSPFERVMACTSIEELETILAGITEEEYAVLTEEQLSQINARISELELQPLPPVAVEESKDEQPVSGEIIYPTVNFDHVAPFGSPVVG